MAEKAQITSVEAIESFRADLVVYLSQMRPVLEEISSEVLRTEAWMEDDRKRYWHQEARRRTRKLEEARQELFTARLAQLGEVKTFQQMAVHRAEQAVREVEARLLLIRKWERDLDDKASPLVKQMEQLHGFLAVEMDRAVTYLDQILRTLEAYRTVAPPPVRTTEDPT